MSLSRSEIRSDATLTGGGSLTWVQLSIESSLELTKGLLLDLARVLQLLNPLGLLVLEHGYLLLNLNSLFVFFVDSTDEVQPLLLFFESLFLGAQLLLLLFLQLNVVAHPLSSFLLHLFLHVNHFLVLLALHLETISLLHVLLHVELLRHRDGLLLALTVQSVLLLTS